MEIFKGTLNIQFGLFALAMEPLAMCIRSSPLIRGLPIGTIEEHISLYTDYTLVYLADPHDSLKKSFV